MTFTPGQMHIINFCAKECELQQSGEVSVGNMLAAWNYAQQIYPEPPNEADILLLGRLVEPVKNNRGYRTVGVHVGGNVKSHHEDIPRLMERLLAAQDDLSPEKWFKEYEDVHPFRDGNGRTGSILLNWLKGTLHKPVWPPNFWDDPRRYDLETA